jgi:transposase
VQQEIDLYTGLDTSKLKSSVAIVDAGRDGEVRFLGDIDSAPAAVEPLVAKLAKRHHRLVFCYEAGIPDMGCLGRSSRSAKNAL